MARCKYQGQFGKLVIGEEEAKREAAAVSEGKQIFGKLVTGKHPTEAEPVAVTVQVEDEVADAIEELVEESSSLSVRAIRDELKGETSASQIDRLVRDEFTRPEGPRKSVLDLLRSKESGRESPREEVIAALEAKLEEL